MRIEEQVFEFLKKSNVALHAESKGKCNISKNV